MSTLRSSSEIDSLDLFDFTNGFSQALDKDNGLPDAKIFFDKLPALNKAEVIQKKSETRQDTFLHLLATQIFNNQDDNENPRKSFKNSLFFMNYTIEILTLPELKPILKDILLEEDNDNFSFLELAVFCRSEQFDFVYQILNIVPLEDRDKCKMDIAGSFKDVLRNDEKAEELRVINALISLFHLSKESDKTTLAKSLLDKISQSSKITETQKRDLMKHLPDGASSSSTKPRPPRLSEIRAKLGRKATRP